MNAPLPPDAVAVASLPVAEIVPSPSNPRKHFDETYIAELAESIKAHGLIQPITVRPLPLDAMFEYNKRRKKGDASAPRYEIVVGECRWRAAQLAGLTEIPGFWRELDDKAVLEIQVIENLGATPARSRADTQPAISPGTRPAGKLDSMSISGRRPAEACGRKRHPSCSNRARIARIRAWKASSWSFAAMRCATTPSSRWRSGG